MTASFSQLFLRRLLLRIFAVIAYFGSGATFGSGVDFAVLSKRWNVLCSKLKLTILRIVTKMLMGVILLDDLAGRSLGARLYLTGFKVDIQ